MLDFFFICCILVFIIDLSGVMDHLNRLVWRTLWPGVKYIDWQIPLISCSLCCTFWSCWIYMMFTGFSWSFLLYGCILSFLTPVIGEIFMIIKDLLIKLLTYLH